ncbi:ATP-binding protein [Shewanella sp. 10N.261.52.F9]|uniref:ATP-binding protein n=1 Tax=Shewanella TaxID=22 RepID=UPI0020103415|nr:ATP-binding protein [Shewanella marinintestina]MCL1146035.1 ATP-binding protein [Shewanella marinintestina]
MLITGEISDLPMERRQSMSVKLLYAPLLLMANLLMAIVLAPPCDAEQWSDVNTPVLTEASQNIDAKVNALPELHLATIRSQNSAANLLLSVFNQQQAHCQLLKNQLQSYKATPSAVNWAQVNSTKLSLDSLNRNKAELLQYVSPRIYDKFTGFGPDGVRQILLEAQSAEAVLNFQLVSQLKNLTDFTADLTVSPFPLLVLIVKLIIIFVILRWWLNIGPRLILAQLEKNKSVRVKREPLSGIFWRYLNKIHKTLAWFIAISLAMSLLEALPGFNSVSYLKIIVNWAFSAAIIIRLLSEFTAHHSHHNNKSEIVTLRVATLKRWVWLIMAAGITLKSTALSVYQGTIYAWVETVILLLLLILLIKTLVDWRSIVFKQLSLDDDHPDYIAWAIKVQNNWLLSPVATLLGIFRLFYLRAFQELFNNLSRYQAFKHAIAYFFRVEVAKQSLADKENSNMVRIKGDDTFLYVQPGHEDSELIEDYAKNELDELAQYVLAPIPALALVYSERGLGLTTLFKQLLHRSKSEHAIYVNCPYGGYTPLIAEINASLGLEGEANEAELISHLRQSEYRYILCIDNCQRLVSPKVNGLTDLMKLSKLLRRGRNQHGAVIGMEQSAWRFIDRARGERLLFDKVIAMPRWNEKQIAALLCSRIDTEGEYALSFAGLKLPRQWDEQDLSELQRAEQGFYRILWDYSDGNPTVALRFFRMSLHKDKTNGNVFVRIFSAPDAKELETMPKPMLAVLRAIVQLEVASAEELSDCTQLGFSEVLNTLRYFQNRGFVELVDDKARISAHWFRYITNTLHNQHLLVK